MCRLTVVSTLGSLVLTFAANAAAPWLPESGQFVVTPVFSYNTFDKFWVGETKVDALEVNDERFEQFTGGVRLDFGIMRRLAADATIGYTEVAGTDTLGRGSDNGLTDTSLGLRYRLAYETGALPTIVLRAGGIIAGTYDETTPFGAGDGAHGLEGSLSFGKNLGAGFGIYADIGYRHLANPVPHEWFGTAGVYKDFEGVFAEEDAISIAVSYRHVQSVNGDDITDPGFDPASDDSNGFPGLKEINQLVGGSIAYRDNGGRYYAIGVAKSVDGRNTGDKLILTVRVMIPFGGE
jgi:hypothetical protein